MVYDYWHVEAKMASVFPTDTAMEPGTKMVVLDLEPVVKYKKSNRSSTDEFFMNEESICITFFTCAS